jgi:hypothetical protein
MKPMNDKPYEHTSRYGTTFKCARCDFREPIYYQYRGEKLSREKLMLDVSELIGFHAANIWENLNGFQGYDTVRFIEGEPPK